jgi:uncharacterized protein YciW
MLRYADKLTRTPGSMRRTDLESLRETGFSDADILHIVEVTAYYAYVNRVADGLGVELEPWIWGASSAEASVETGVETPEP